MEREYGAHTGGGYTVDREAQAYRRMLGRKHVDYGSSVVQWMRHRRPRYKGGSTLEAERPSGSYIVDMLPPAARPQNAAETIPARHLHSSLNKIKHPINIVRWTPEGRRCLTGSTSGEFTLWNGMAFNFETIMQAHDTAIRAAEYSHSEDWLVSADHEGIIKYWQPNFNNVKVIQAHNDPIRDLAFSPNDSKFVTACDDTTLKIFDFAEGAEELTLTGHGWDAKTVDWHPTKGLLASGSKDHQVKLWDPRTGRCLTTLHGHKNTVAKTSFDPHRGHMLATCARDPTARIFDLRMMRDICLLRGHEKDISTLTWHPVHPNLVSTGGADGSVYHYLLDEPNPLPGTSSSLPPYDSADPSNAPAQTIYPAHKVQHAHDFPVWSLSWHPLGHILASGSNDRVTRFWTRPRPGDKSYLHDRYHLGEAGAEAQGTWDRRGGRRAQREEEEQEVEDEAEGLVDQKMPAKQSMLPGLPGLTSDGFSEIPGLGPINGNHLPIPPPPIPGMVPALPPGIPPPQALVGMNYPDFAAKMASGSISLPWPPPPGAAGFPPPPGMPGFPPPPPDFDISKLPPEVLKNLPGGYPGALPPQPPPQITGGMGPGGVPNFGRGSPSMPMERSSSNGSAGRDDAPGGAGVRKRGPLPSQKESLKLEQKRGNFRHAR